MVRSLRGWLCHAADDEQLRIVRSLRGLVMRLLRPGPGYNGGNAPGPNEEQLTRWKTLPTMSLAFPGVPAIREAGTPVKRA